MIKRILDFSHHLLTESVQKGETVIDATCGNGFDTLFLSDLVGKAGKVLAFDIQKQAIQNTKKLLDKNSSTNVSLFHDSHASMDHYLQGKIGGAIFNLGYLPGSDKSIITKGKSTIAALATVLHALKKDRLAVLVVYYGHAGGNQEKDALLTYVTKLDQRNFSVLYYGFINQKNQPPFIIAIHKNR